MTTGGEGRVRVAVVDDDEINRRGVCACLDDDPRIEVVASLDHDTARAWSEAWDGVDVALVDAADEHHEPDNFPGVAVVERIRARRRADQTLIIVLTGHFFDDAVRRRMREANADYFFWRGDVHDATALRRIVLEPGAHRPGVPDVEDPAALAELGIRQASSVNTAVDIVAGHHPARIGSPPAPRSRVWTRFRRAFGANTGIGAVNTDGSLPRRAQDDPSLAQIERIWTWATRAKQPPRR